MTVSEFKNRITGVKKPVAMTCAIEDVRIVFGGTLKKLDNWQVSRLGAFWDTTCSSEEFTETASFSYSCKSIVTRKFSSLFEGERAQHISQEVEGARAVPRFGICTL